MWLNVCPGFISGLRLGDESNLPSGCPLEPDVTVCGVESSLVQVTVSPTLASTGFGSNESVVLLDEPGVIDTAIV